MEKQRNFYKKLRSIFRSVPEATLCFCVLVMLGLTLSCENSAKTESKSKENLPPVVDSITILPENPTKDSELNAFVQSHDPDGDVVTFQYQWMRNQEEIVGEEKNNLKKGNLRKGDLIQVRVTPCDGKANGRPYLSPPVKIVSAPPVIQEVRIEPRVGYANDNLKALVKASDVGENLITYNYQWEKKGIIISEQGKDTLERGQFKKGDWIAVTVIPDDGEMTWSPKKSDPVTIANSPPIITSSPSNKTEGNIYTYQVMANDPDDDPVTFDLKTGPRGMEINNETGLIRWEIRKEDQGAQLIEIEASDSEGAKSIQRYTLSIQFR
jgi:hypothetical protein